MYPCGPEAEGSDWLGLSRVCSLPRLRRSRLPDNFGLEFYRLRERGFPKGREMEQTKKSTSAMVIDCVY